MNIKEEGKNTTTLKGLKITSPLYKTPLDLTFENDCYIFVGRNGTGKTILLEILNRKKIDDFPWIDVDFPLISSVVYKCDGKYPSTVLYLEKSHFDIGLSFRGSIVAEQNEEKVSAYINVANKYLRGKCLSYSPSDYRYPCYIKLKDKHGDVISIETLTRGEYRVLSILYDAYLPRATAPMLFLIDTPEYNLCVPSKIRIIDDILKSGNVGLLIVATHSATVINDRWHNVVNLDDYV